MNRQVLSLFEDYQKARLAFANRLADLAQRASNVEALAQAGAVDVLQALLLDAAPLVQQAAAVTLGRLAGFSLEIAAVTCKEEILGPLLRGLNSKNAAYKRTVLGVLRSVARASEPLAAKLLAADGLLTQLQSLLDDPNPAVKEATCGVLAALAKQSPALAESVAQGGALVAAVRVYGEPDPVVKRACAPLLAELCRADASVAHQACDQDLPSLLAGDLAASDPGVRRGACLALAAIACHNPETADAVVAQGLWARLLLRLQDADESVRRAAVSLLKDTVKHSQQHARDALDAGAGAALCEFLRTAAHADALAGVLATGYIAAFDEVLAMALLHARAAPALLDALDAPDAHLTEAAAWTLAQLGRHSAEHCRVLAELRAPQKLLAAQTSDTRTQAKIRETLALLLPCLQDLPALNYLLLNATKDLYPAITAQLAKVLPADVNARKEFVKHQGLRKLQEIRDDPDCKDCETAITAINNSFPKDLVHYNDPKWSDKLLQQLDAQA